MENIHLETHRPFGSHLQILPKVVLSAPHHGSVN